MQLLGRNWLELFKPKDGMVNVIEVIGLFNYLPYDRWGRGGRDP